MRGSWGQNLQSNLNIAKQIIHNLAYLVYSNRNSGENEGGVPPDHALPQLCLKHKEHQRHQPDNT